MKSFIIMTLAAFAFVSLQTKANDTQPISYDWPVVNGLSIENACATETTFRATKPSQFCAEEKVVSLRACQLRGEAEVCRDVNPGDRIYSGETVTEVKKCVKFDTHFAEVSRTVTETKCTKWTPVNEVSNGECTESQTVTRTLDTHFKVAMYAKGARFGGPKNYLGEKDYEVPQCP